MAGTEPSHDEIEKVMSLTLVMAGQKREAHLRADVPAIHVFTL
jgi:hypothetical protein